MVPSIHYFAAFQSDSSWPSFWPPVRLPPPSPLSEAATSLWSPPRVGGADTALALDPSGPLYSTRLGSAGQSSADGAGRFQMAFLDQRIALMRFDASHATNSGAA